MARKRNSVLYIVSFQKRAERCENGLHPLAEATHIGYTFKSNHDQSEEGPMTGNEVLQSVQFVTVKGKRLAVLSADDWEALIEWLETLEDTAIAKEAFAQLKAADGDRTKAGWLKWFDVADELV